jgi:hypothetical protein
MFQFDTGSGWTCGVRCDAATSGGTGDGGLTGSQCEDGVGGESVCEAEEEFDEDVPYFAGIDSHAGEVRGQLEPDLDIALAEFGCDGVNGLFKEIGEVVDLDVLLSVSGELEEALNDGVRLARRVFEVRQHQLVCGRI